ncbi:GNAT family N-acetyltransferase [Bacillus sp. DTU_2020_1000418_1_SI_GHA_SEK_038]|uniref:GNAT family N-acetyltransferase n=1 Tax=Bacillus sp. DTU_2020_1000418_1_SI_GHA_SEK_038 TaxID=3077585 RepID=UPI0028E5D115|nr:GNAT family N-acetyltransferase [Bacillus sp. DTU_2020_1000418_1_SI_GHA_SEK_038]WNS75374.1 GNAT family N-acetyltransferase [Bacillus sp. DTU_2020_1000418_1_SI_GHA_SEK_038]
MMDITISQVTFREITPIIPYIKQAKMKIGYTENTSWIAAKNGDELVGVVGYTVYPEVILYRTDFVKRNYRGRGIYKLLFAERDRLVSKLGSKTVIAYCTKYSLGYYLNNGFKEIRKLKKVTYVERVKPI